MQVDTQTKENDELREKNFERLGHVIAICIKFNCVTISSCFL